MSKYEYADAVKALESLRATYDYPPTHRQFTEAVHAVGKARDQHEQAQRAISQGAEWSSNERKKLAKENVAKLRGMLRTIGNYGKDVA